MAMGRRRLYPGLVPELPGVRTSVSRGTGATGDTWESRWRLASGVV
jgi:hypothetical protein